MSNGNARFQRPGRAGGSAGGSEAGLPFGTPPRVGGGGGLATTDATPVNQKPGAPSYSQLNYLIEDLRALLENTEHSDVTFVLDDGSSLTANRSILAARSQVFKAMLFGPMAVGPEQQARLSDISARCFRGVLEWAYTGGLEKLLAELAPKPPTPPSPTLQPTTQAGFASAPHFIFAAPHAHVSAANASAEQRAEAPQAPVPVRPTQVLRGSPPAEEAEPNKPEAPAEAPAADQTIYALCEVLEAADLYNMERLRELCSKELAARFNAASVSYVLGVAAARGADKLKAECLAFISSHRAQVHARGGLDALSKELLIEAFLAGGGAAPEPAQPPRREQQFSSCQLFSGTSSMPGALNTN
jgi:hypothetical protein